LRLCCLVPRFDFTIEQRCIAKADFIFTSKYSPQWV